jgi:hypothetical protein
VGRHRWGPSWTRGPDPPPEPADGRARNRGPWNCP